MKHEYTGEYYESFKDLIEMKKRWAKKVKPMPKWKREWRSEQNKE